MKKTWLALLMGLLLFFPSFACSQPDRMPRPPYERGERSERGGPRVLPSDLRVVQLEMSPDPIIQGQRISFHVTISNASGNPARVNLYIKDSDEVIVEANDVILRPGMNRVDFPQTPGYRFVRTDHCFKIEVDIEGTRSGIDLAREFCARKTARGWSLNAIAVGPLFVENMEMAPDPVLPGQEVRFRLRLRNEGIPVRANVRIQDKDETVVQARDVSLIRGYSDIQFPYTRYRFERFDHCFTVIVDVEMTPYPADAAKQFCAHPGSWSLR